MHSQQKADAEAENATASAGHDSSAGSGTLNHLADELDNDHDDPLALDDDAEDVPFISREMTFGEPLHASPPTHPRDGSEIDAILLRDAKADVDAPEVASSEGKGKGSYLTSSPGNMRHLDLDDFANSPAADADDRGFDEADSKVIGGGGIDGRIATG